jgi:hypothetical protein
VFLIVFFAIPVCFLFSRAGWTLIGPSSWANVLWRCLSHVGVRAVGLEEWKERSFYSFAPHFPMDYPDTAAGAVLSLILSFGLVLLSLCFFVFVFLFHFVSLRFCF